MSQEKLKKFIRLLQKVQKQPNRTFDLGLIIKEPKNKISSGKILEAIKKLTDIEKITYDKSIADEDVIEKIIDAFEKSKWVVKNDKKRNKMAKAGSLK